MMRHTLHLGDCLEVLRTMADCSIDAVVTDPPYGLAFMGKRWDYDVPSVEIWAECLRVLKPGGHLLAFAGTRTQHRMACRIEDAGFEIRDMIAWVYGSGFPKSLDVSKAIDKCNGQPNRLHKFTAWMRTTGLTARQLDQITDTNMGGNYLTAGSQPAIPTAALWDLVRPHCGEVPAWVDELVQRIEAEREVVGQKTAGIANPDDRDRHTIGGSAAVVVDITAPATPEAQQWAGWGTALKPALEPITMARKPLTGTVAANVLEHGTGALNVDGCRVKTTPGDYDHPGDLTRRPMARHSYAAAAEGAMKVAQAPPNPSGRWPANLIHDGSDEPNELLGSAARFFYTAKASSRERQGVAHPTVKPLDLMAYLCRLVTPPGGIVLDPFMGSGTTIKAAVSEGFNAIGIERDPAYFAMAEHRMNKAQLGLGI
jgi:DNA modification methylase